MSKAEPACGHRWLTRVCALPQATPLRDSNPLSVSETFGYRQGCVSAEAATMARPVTRARTRTPTRADLGSELNAKQLTFKGDAEPNGFAGWTSRSYARNQGWDGSMTSSSTRLSTPGQN